MFAVKMYFFYLCAKGITVVQFFSVVMAQNLEYSIEQVEYAPNKWDQFSVFREVQFKIGEPEPEFPSSAATNVAFLRCNFSKIPDRFFYQLPQLEVLVIRDGTLEELKVKNRMKIVHAENNQITSLRIEGSGEMLKELHIRENPLRNINPIVSSLRGLEVLDLSRTNVAVQNDETIDLSLFASLPNLTELYLTSMHAHYVENEKHATLPKLKRLDLSGNPIIPSNFKLEVFRTIPNLEELYLRDTIMSYLTVSDIREDLPALKRLYLDGNSFRCDLLELLLAHFKEKGLVTPAQSRKCDLGYESIEGLCCISYIKDVPRNETRDPGTVTQPPMNSETANTTTSITTDKTRTEEQTFNERINTNEFLLYVGIAIAVLVVVVAIIAFFVLKRRKHHSVPTHDTAPHDEL